MKVEVDIVTTPQYTHVKSAEPDFHVVVNLKTSALEENVERIPFELACVLDISGSMAGSKLAWSKRAIRKVIKHMSPKDTLHFVTYESRVRVVFEDGDLKKKEQLVEKVRAVSTQGCTNISGGLDKAKDLLLKSKKKCVKRIFLFSDGEANEGIEDHKKMFDFVKKIHSQGITVTSFGIGEGFDGRMMEGIGAAGKGSFLYLSEEGNAITSQVSKAIHDMMDLIGTDAILKLKPLNGTKIKKLYDNEMDSKVNFQIGDILADNDQQILISVSLDPSKREDKSAMEFKYLDYTLDYTSKKKNEKLLINGSCSVNVTKDEKLVVEENAVKIARTVQSVSDVNEQVMNLIENGKKSEAVKMKEVVIKQLEAIKEQDESGYVEMLLGKENETLTTMKTANVQKAKKKVLQTRFRSKKKSKRCYSSGEDSDEDDWSDDANISRKAPVKNYGRKKIKPSMISDEDDDSDYDDEDDDDDLDSPSPLPKKKKKKKFLFF